MFQAEAFEACLPVVEAFDDLKIDCLIGGSLASSFHGIPRSTLDVDLVADLRASQVPLLVARLEGDFYLARERIEAAVRRRASFNLIYLRTMFKVDVFVVGSHARERRSMLRRQRVELAGGKVIHIASAEDTVLRKLAWYRLGGEVSDRQWQDALGVLKVTGTALDRHYLASGAEAFEVSDLLARAFLDAGLD